MFSISSQKILKSRSSARLSIGQNLGITSFKIVSLRVIDTSTIPYRWFWYTDMNFIFFSFACRLVLSIRWSVQPFNGLFTLKKGYTHLLKLVQIEFNLFVEERFIVKLTLDIRFMCLEDIFESFRMTNVSLLRVFFSLTTFDCYVFGDRTLDLPVKAVTEPLKNSSLLGSFMF